MMSASCGDPSFQRRRHCLLIAALVLPTTLPVGAALRADEQPELPVGLTRSVAAALQDQVFIFGGWTDAGEVSQVLKYDITSGKLRDTSFMLPKDFHPMAAFASGNAVLVSGVEFRSRETGAIAVTYAFEPSGLWQLQAAEPVHDIPRWVVTAREGDFFWIVGEQNGEVTIYWANETAGRFENVTVVLPERMTPRAKVFATADTVFFLAPHVCRNDSCDLVEWFGSVFEVNLSTGATIQWKETIPEGFPAQPVWLGNQLWSLGGSVPPLNRAVDTVLRFDTSTRSIDVPVFRLPVAVADAATASVGNSVYVIGGVSDQSQQQVLRTVIRVSMENDPPRAEFSLSTSGLVVHADAGASKDLDGDVRVFQWDWGDGHTGGGSRALHVYEQPGTYQVRLTVIDNDGATAENSSVMIISPVVSPPQPSAPASRNAGEETTRLPTAEAHSVLMAAMVCLLLAAIFRKSES